MLVLTETPIAKVNVGDMFEGRVAGRRTLNRVTQKRTSGGAQYALDYVNAKTGVDGFAVIAGDSTLLVATTE